MIKFISGHELIQIQIYSIPQDLNYVSYFDISMWLSAKLHYAHKYKIDAIYDFIFSDLNIFLKSTLSIQSSRFSCKIERDSPLTRLNIFECWKGCLTSLYGKIGIYCLFSQESDHSLTYLWQY